MSKFSLSLVDRQIRAKDALRFLLIVLLLGVVVFSCVLFTSKPGTPLGELKGQIVGIFGGTIEEGHVHQWVEATCKAPKHCPECGEREGTPLQHDWADATCELPMTCKSCETTYGEALGHKWTLLTCVQDKACTVCHIVDTPAPGHGDDNMIPATCTAPKTCKAGCGYTEGEPLGHVTTSEVIDPTCTTNGYTALTCSVCNNVEKTDIVPALGHTPVDVEKVDATCTDKGNEAGQRCDVCGFNVSGCEAIMPKGHLLNDGVVTPATCTDDGSVVKSCMRSGCDYEEITVIHALGHEYGDVKCGKLAACSREGCTSQGETVVVEHVWSEPTCTEPSRCTRTNCSVSGGAINKDAPALGHNMSEPTCMAPSTCLNGCGYKLDDKIGHNLDVSYSAGTLQYICSMCSLSFKLDKYYRLDGSGFQGMEPVSNSSNYHTHTEKDKPTEYPVMKDGYYELVKKETTGDTRQLQIWVPSQNADRFGFTSANSAVGVFSFKINALMDGGTGLTMQFVDNSAGGERWSKEWCLTEKFFNISAPTTDKTDGTVLVTVTGWDGIVLKRVDVTGISNPENMYTGWFDVKIAIVLDPKYDTITLYYYIDGVFVASSTKEITTTTNGINSIYISGNSVSGGSGVKLDDVCFGYTAAGNWVFAEHEHTWKEVSREDNTCVEGSITYSCACGVAYKVGLPAAHNVVVLPGRETTCAQSGLTTGKYCADCKTVLIAQRETPAFDHVEEFVGVLRPTCTEDGHTDGYRCSVCYGVIPGKEHVYAETIPALGHDYDAGVTVDPTCTEAGKITYTCQREGCGYEYVVDLDAHHTASDMVSPVVTAPTCTDEGYTTYECSVCGEKYNADFVPATGHDFTNNGDNVVDSRDPACTVPGYVVIQCVHTGCTETDTVELDPIGHDYGSAKCGEETTCQRAGCGVTYTVEHVYSDPTCTEKATCTICGEVDENSSALGHNFENDSCVPGNKCTQCELEYDAHKLEAKYQGGMLTYVCANEGCECEYAVSEFHYADGSNHDKFIGVSNGSNGFDVVAGTNNPVIVEENGNKYYQMIRNETTGVTGQHQLWMPTSNKTTALSDFTCANNAVGVFSFSMSANIDSNDTIGFRFVNGRDETWDKSGNDKDGWGDSSFTFLNVKKSGSAVQITDMKGKTVGSVSTSSNGWTEWFDVTVVVKLSAVGEKYKMTLLYYFGNDLVTTVNDDMPIWTHGIDAVYVNGNIRTANRGYKIDNIALGATVNGHWTLDGETHVWTPATCTTPATCSCGATKGKALGHNLSEATCTTLATCQREGCGHTEGELGDHQMASATCTDSAKCTLCGVTSGEPLGHRWALDAKCGEAQVCVRCDYTSDTEIVPHIFADATCTDPMTCIRPGCSVDEDGNFVEGGKPATTGDPLGHDMAGATCTEPSTCKTEGCGYTVGEPLGHKIIDATCIGPEMCDRCGTFISAPLGHDMADATCTEPSTCKREGCNYKEGEPNGHVWPEGYDCRDKQVCTLEGCGHTSDDIIGHVTVIDERVEPTCTESGLTAGSHCGHCLEPLDVQEVIPATGHNDEVAPAKEATCTETGLTEGRVCKVCGTVTSEQTEVPELGHDLEAATCTAPVSCTRCDYTVGTALGHDWGEATCGAPQKCERPGCGYESTDVIEHVWIAATCYSDKTCAICGQVETDTKLSNHVFTSKLDGTIMTYRCACEGCGYAYSLDTDLDSVLYYDKTEKDPMWFNANEFTKTVSDDGVYSMISIYTNGKQGKGDLYLPSQNNTAGFEGFSCANNSVGVISFKIQSSQIDTLSFALTESRADNKGWVSWTQSAIDILSISGVTSSGADVTLTGGFLDGSNKFTRTISVNDGWTEWIDVAIFVELSDLDTSKMLKLHYYINGDYCGSDSRDLKNPGGKKTISTYTIRSLYITGYSKKAGTGYRFKDMTFGYVENGHCALAGTGHVYTPATCQSVATCSCGYIGTAKAAHDLTEATCYAPSVCQTEGCEYKGQDALGHLWKDTATCGDPQECVRANCGYKSTDPIEHDWIAATCVAPSTCARCSITTGDVIEHEWVDATCLEPAKCKSGCGATNGEPAGHLFGEATCTTPATCTRPGCFVDDEGNLSTEAEGGKPATKGEPNGHTWAEGAKCSDLQECTVCDHKSETEIIGHLFGEATCTEPATCTRPGCSVNDNGVFVEGGHPATTGEPNGHSIVYTGVRNTLTYSCKNCTLAYTVDNEHYYLDGQSTNLMVGVGNNATAYESTNPKEYTDNKGNTYYGLINKSGSHAKAEFWIPSGNKHDAFVDFTCKDNSVGVLSFKVNTSFNRTDQKNEPDYKLGLDVQLTDNDGRGSTFDWKSHAMQIISIAPPRTDKNGNTTVVVYGLGENVIVDEDKGTVEYKPLELAVLSVETAEEGEPQFSGWIDISVGIQLHQNKTITLYYYVNGKHIINVTRNMPISTAKINSLYMCGYTEDKGGGVMLDDFAFGYTTNGHWTLDSEDAHVITEATCTSPKTCSCGYTFGEALGHNYGDTKCGSVGSCQREGCENKNITIEHDWKEANCAYAQTCKICKAIYVDENGVESKPLGHDWGDAACGDPQECIRKGCGFSSTNPIPHEYAEATCTKPQTCTRDKCNATYGEPNGHVWDDSSPATCTVCGAKICEATGHNFVYTASAGTLTYSCKNGCGVTYTVDNVYNINNSSYNGLSGGGKLDNQTYFTTNDVNGDYLPVYNESGKYYEFVKDYSKDIYNTSRQVQLWIDSGLTGFSADNDAEGFLSFRINANMDQSFYMQFTEGNSAVMDKFFVLGAPVTNGETKTVSIRGWGTKIGERHLTNVVLDPELGGYTGWIDVMIRIKLDSNADTIQLDYYINGLYISSGTRALTSEGNSITGVYINGYTGAFGSGYKLSNVYMGYNVSSEEEEND